MHYVCSNKLTENRWKLVNYIFGQKSLVVGKARCLRQFSLFYFTWYRSLRWKRARITWKGSSWHRFIFAYQVLFAVITWFYLIFNCKNKFSISTSIQMWLLKDFYKIDEYTFIWYIYSNGKEIVLLNSCFSNKCYPFLSYYELFLIMEVEWRFSNS